MFERVYEIICVHTFIAKTALARHYIEILSIGKDSLDAKKLLNYKAPMHTLKVGFLVNSS